MGHPAPYDQTGCRNGGRRPRQDWTQHASEGQRLVAACSACSGTQARSQDHHRRPPHAPRSSKWRSAPVAPRPAPARLRWGASHRMRMRPGDKQLEGHHSKSYNGMASHPLTHAGARVSPHSIGTAAVVARRPPAAPLVIWSLQVSGLQSPHRASCPCGVPCRSPGPHILHKTQCFIHALVHRHCRGPGPVVTATSPSGTEASRRPCPETFGTWCSPLWLAPRRQPADSRLPVHPTTCLLLTW